MVSMAAGGLTAFIGISIEFYVNRKKTDGEVIMTFFAFALLWAAVVLVVPNDISMVHAILLSCLPHLPRLMIRHTPKVIDREIVKHHNRRRGRRLNEPNL